ncbi:hypothetical protein ACFUMH_01755 [Cellulomonas sp. NPDC057328]|uniref:hypothetical protein n=1 Tax=Cellulomonas sp. NPDC057328 TaxID=3346101 RepID=UPI0036279C10
MDANEYGEFLRYTRERVRLSGRADIDEQAVRSQFGGADRVDDAVISYLVGLRSELALRSETGAREAMRRFRGVSTDTGQPIEGIVLDLVGEDAAAYGTDRIELSGRSALNEVVADLDQLISEIIQDRPVR